jgi:hypothetical protein
MAQFDNSFTAAELTSLNPFIPTGVFMVERDTGKTKLGTGTQWSTRPYWNDAVLTTEAIAASAATLVARVTSTTTALEDVGAAINTADKYAGKLVWNTTTGVLLCADGAAADDTWSTAAGAATHTPV